MNPREKAIRRARKLDSLARGKTTPGPEARAARAAQTRVMRRHGISRADLIDDCPPTRETGTRPSHSPADQSVHDFRQLFRTLFSQ